ncbi:MAG: glycosyltransferase family 4 protein [Bacteriovoracaceae bacterium]
MSNELKVGINGRPLCHSSMRGLARHTYELINALHVENPNLEIHLFTYGKIDKRYKEDLTYVHFHESHPRIKILWDLFFLPRALKQHGIKLFHSTNNLGVPWDRSIRKLVTIHDDLTHRDRMKGPWWSRFNYCIEFFLLKESDQFITVSQSAKNDLVRTMNLPIEKISVIYNGVKRQAICPREQKNFYLYVGGLEERKNIPFMLDALEAVSSSLTNPIELHLVASLESATDETQKRLKDSPLLIKIHQNISDSDLTELYGQAKALINPSNYEGFGLPLIEAMQMKVPLIISKLDVFQEITEKKAFFFSPNQAQELKKIIEDFEGHQLSHDQFAHDNFERSNLFTWQMMAKLTMNIYQHLGLGKNYSYDTKKHGN